MKHIVDCNEWLVAPQDFLNGVCTHLIELTVLSTPSLSVLTPYRRCLNFLQDFLNGVCTHIIWLTDRKLTYYTGNYDTFVKTVAENEVVQQKK